MGFKDLCNNMPSPAELSDRAFSPDRVPEINGHLHTPWSFCAFENIDQMFEMATAENVVLLGINDFFSVDGYEEFEKSAVKSRVFPLFNIEFIGLMKEFQENNIRINDPVNPGRVYICGKALEHPLNISSANLDFLDNLQANSQLQVMEISGKTSEYLKSLEAPFSFEFEKLRYDFARNIVRERHIARAIREYSWSAFPGDSERLIFLKNLFGGTEPDSSLENSASLENEIRSRLLKKGGPAFVPEEEDAFPALSRIIEFIVDAGGIPCYPVFLDNKEGELTGFESDWDRMDEVFRSMNVSCLELIPVRNSLSKLEEFVRFFDEKDYVISFGTEHNSPTLFPIKVSVEGNKELPEYLKEVSWKGASVLAAHQYLHARGEEGFINYEGVARTSELDYFRRLGQNVIHEFTGQ